MSIFHKLRTKKQEQFVSDHQAYFNLLAVIDIDNPTAKQTEQLEGLTQSLSKSIDQMEKDYSDIQDAKRNQQVLSETINAVVEHEKAQQAHADACLKRQQGHAELNENVRLATVNQFAATDTLKRRQDAQTYIKEVEKSAPHILSAIAATKRNGR